MRLTVVGIRQRRGVEVPIHRVFLEIGPDGFLEGTVIPFHLPICLGVVGCGKPVLYIENLADRLEKLRREAFSIVCQYMGRSAVVKNPFVDECTGDFGRRHSLE